MKLEDEIRALLDREIGSAPAPLTVHQIVERASRARVSGGEHENIPASPSDGGTANTFRGADAFRPRRRRVALTAAVVVVGVGAVGLWAVGKRGSDPAAVQETLTTRFDDLADDELSAFAREVAENPRGMAGWFGLGGTESESIFDATQLLNQSCMRGHGYDVPADDYGTQSIPPAGDYQPTQPAELGYRPPAGEGSTGSVVDAWISDHPDAAELFVECDRQTAERLLGSPDGYVGLLEPIAPIVPLVQQRVEDHPGLGDLNADWSECMQAEGYDYREPTEPWQVARSGDAPSADEVSERASDLACRDRVGYAPRLDDIEAEVVLGTVDAPMLNRLVAARTTYHDTAARAAELVSAPDPNL